VMNRCIMMRTNSTLVGSLKTGRLTLTSGTPNRCCSGGEEGIFIHDAGPTLQITRESSRICLGKQFALRVLFLTIARTLATFDISMCLDEDGNPVVPDGKFAPGGVS